MPSREACCVSGKKKKHLLEEEVTKTRQDNSVCVEEAGDVLSKNTAFSVQTYAKEDETVEGDRPLDLNPKPHYPEEPVVDNNCSTQLGSSSNMVPTETYGGVLGVREGDGDVPGGR